jgi:serine phosphatase RsbU (regulator of sigma subunit)
MWTMILKMSAATLIYVLITAGLWFVCRKKEKLGTGLQVVIGLIYGGCSVLANHIGIDYGDMILNVRDIGPLAAGLFFSPVSGIIAGIIGGAERILAGELWNIGRFTELACGMSTFLAGLLAALLNKKIYKGHRPPVTQALFLGAVMEVFHMYAVLFTNRQDMAMAYRVVQTAAIPMIIFTATGMALCSAVVLKVSGEKPQSGLLKDEGKIPLTVHFQRRLMIVTIGVVLINFAVSWGIQTRIADSNASSTLNYISYENNRIYEESGKNIEVLRNHLQEQYHSDVTYWLVDAESGEFLVVPGINGLAGNKIKAADLENAKENADQQVYRTAIQTADGIEVLCSSRYIGEDAVLMVMEPLALVYANRDGEIYENTLSDLLLFAVLYVLVAMLLDTLVIRSLQRVNVSLDRITDGHLDEKVWVRSSSEFSALSDDINEMVTALRGYIDQAEKRMRDELKLAKSIQDAALPKNFAMPGENIDLYALMTPAKQVGGDFYDFFYCDRDKLCLVIADVSGKGVPAALFMMRAKTAIKNYARHGNSAAKVLEHVNHTLCEGNDAEMFVTVWLGILDLNTGKIQCANAGHEYPVLMRAGGNYELLKDKHGLALAALDGISMKEYEIDLDPGDRLFVYTDGVPEAINEKVEAYGTERLCEKLNTVKNVPQQQALESVLRDIRNFAGAAEQFDDITMLGITFGRVESGE